MLAAAPLPKLAGIVRTIQERNRRNEAEARNTARSYDEIMEKQRQILWAHRAAILVPYHPRAADIEEATVRVLTPEGLVIAGLTTEQAVRLVRGLR